MDVCLNAMFDHDSTDFFVYSSGEVLGSLCAKLGPQIYSRTQFKILGGIQTNLERQPLSESGNLEQESAEQLAEKLSSSPGRVLRYFEFEYGHSFVINIIVIL